MPPREGHSSTVAVAAACHRADPDGPDWFQDAAVLRHLLRRWRRLPPPGPRLSKAPAAWELFGEPAAFVQELRDVGGCGSADQAGNSYRIAATKDRHGFRRPAPPRLRNALVQQSRQLPKGLRIERGMRSTREYRVIFTPSGRAPAGPAACRTPRKRQGRRGARRPGQFGLVAFSEPRMSFSSIRGWVSGMTSRVRQLEEVADQPRRSDANTRVRRSLAGSVDALPS